MADFARFVTAAEPALEQPQGTFLAAYRQNRSVATENSLDGDSVVDTIRELSLPWRGQSKALLAEIPLSEQRPKSARALGDALRRLAQALRQIGIEIAFGTVIRGQRLIEISQRTTTAAAAPILGTEGRLSFKGATSWSP